MSDVTHSATLAVPRSVRGQQWLQHVSLLIIVLVLAVFAWLSPIFLTMMNLGNVLQQTAVVGTLALGLTLVLSGGGLQGITGGIDLSIAANLGLSAAVFASQLNAGQPIAIALLLTLLTGAAVGLFNALAIVWLGILPLLATLTSMNIAIGLEMVLTSNASVSASSDLQNLLLSNGPLAVSWLGWSFLLLAFEPPDVLWSALAGGGQPSAGSECGGHRRQTLSGFELRVVWRQRGYRGDCVGVAIKRQFTWRQRQSVDGDRGRAVGRGVFPSSGADTRRRTDQRTVLKPDSQRLSADQCLKLLDKRRRRRVDPVSGGVNRAVTSSPVKENTRCLTLCYQLSRHARARPAGCAPPSC